MANVLFDISLIIFIATLFAFIARFLKQPLIPAYILGGVFLGPVMGILTNTGIITTLAEIGIAFLLFIVGLEIDIRRLKDVGIVASIGGIIQVAATFSFAFIVSLLLGFIAIEAVYIALVIAFSSTMVVVKLLSDKREVDTLHGKIIIGIMLIQDIVAILALSVLVTLGKFSMLALLASLFKGLIALLIALAISKYAFPSVFNFAAKSQELLFISAVAISLLYSIIFSYLGFSIAIGAFIAGISLANLPYNIQIIGKIKSLRDFFSVMFFVSLGTQLVLGGFNSLIIPLIVLLVVVILVKPLIVMFIISFFGYKKRTAFLSSISLAQISEFSLIIVAQGFLLGHISEDLLSLTILLAIITITSTSYFIKFEDRIYAKFARYLDVFDKLSQKKAELEFIEKGRKIDVILCGYNRIGYGIVKALKKTKKTFLIVDFNPEIIKRLVNEKVSSLYGDIGDIEVLERLDFKNAKMVISTIPTKTDNELLIKTARSKNKKIIIFVTASQIEEALELYDYGADYVVLPHFLGGEHVSLLIQKVTFNVNKLISSKIKHVNDLKERRALGHEHPLHQ